MMPLFSCVTIKISHGEPSSARQRSVIRGTLVTSCAMRKILTGNDARELRRWLDHQAARVLEDNHALTGKSNGLHDAECSACSRHRTRWMRPWPDRVSVNDRFSTNRIRDADDGAGRPGRMLGQGILQLGGVRDLLVGNDHVLDQVDHVPVSPAGPWPPHRPLLWVTYPVTPKALSHRESALTCIN